MDKKIVLFILLSTVVISCATRRHATSQIGYCNKEQLMILKKAAKDGDANAAMKLLTISQIDYYNLTKEQLMILKKAAKNGDANAAMKISDYYGFALQDNENSLIWLKKAAELGNENAKDVLPETLKMVGKKLEDISSPDSN